MATSSLLGIDSDNLPATHSATGIDSLGPSDASDSGSDSAGAYSAEPDSDTDRFGTGERGSVQADEPADAQDILPDHIENTATGNPDDAAGPDDGMLDDEPPTAEPDGARGAGARGGRGAGGAKPLGPDDLPADADTEDGDTDADGNAQGR